MPAMLVLGSINELQAQTTYCTPTFSPVGVSAATQPISLVQFGTGAGSINNPSSATVSTAVPKYEDFSAISMNVQRGSTYPLLVKGNTDGNNTNYITVYIDWNGDGTFSNSLSQNEKYQSIPALVNSTGTDNISVSTNITVPADAVLGSTRMRIVKNYQAPSPAPCTSVATFGQVEDYTLVIADSASVYNVTIATQNNVPATIATANGTLQLTAAVAPVSTANQNVTWSIDAGATLGTISNTGLVSANAHNGTIIVRATSVQDNTKYGTLAVNLAVPQTPATLTYTDSFETTSDWAFVSQPGVSPTAWVIGTAAHNGGSKGLYVSKDNGVTNTIDASVVSTVHTYRDIIIPNGTTNTTLSFDWKAEGDYYNGGWGYQVYNFMQAWIVPKSYTPAAGTLISNVANAVQLQGPQPDGNFLAQSTFTTYSNASLNMAAFAGDTVRLVFTWKNINGSTGTPAAIDNIYFGLPQPTVDSLTITTANNVPANITTQNGSLQLNAMVWPASISQNVSWTSTSGTTVATVNANGLVSGLSNGTATIRATSTLNPAIYDEIQVTVNIPATPVASCDTLTTFSFDLENFSAFPEQCWTANQSYPMVSLGNTAGNKFIQAYSATNATQDIYIVSPPVSTIDGNHTLSFDVLSAGTDLMVTIGSMSDTGNYNSFVASGAAFAPAAGSSYTSESVAATAGHHYVAIKISPNGVHKVLGIDNVKWQPATTSINELNRENAVIIYPNPAKNIIYIDTKIELAGVELYNVLGQQLQTTHQRQLNLSNLNAGVYFIKVNSKNGFTKTFRIVKQ